MRLSEAIFRNNEKKGKILNMFQLVYQQIVKHSSKYLLYDQSQ